MAWKFGLKYIKWPWPLTFYVNAIAPGVGGRNTFGIVRIIKKLYHDQGIYMHECFHVAQCLTGWAVWTIFVVAMGWPWWAALPGFALHGLIYKGVRKYRLWSEVQAYKVQMRYPNRYGRNMTLDEAVERLTDKDHYKIGLSPEDARKLLA